MMILESVIRRIGERHLRNVCLSEFKNQRFSFHNERSIEHRFALEALAESRPETVLDVGTGPTAWPQLLRHCGYVVAAIDNVYDYWPNGMFNRHWTVLDVDILQPDAKLQKRFGAITCISVLEHIEDHLRAIRNMVTLIKDGGFLVLTTPFCFQNPYPNVYEHPKALYGRDFPFPCQSSSRLELEQWLSARLTLVRRELWWLFT